MYEYYKARKQKLHNRDAKRIKEAEWFKKKDMLGMMLYIDNFAGNLQGVQTKLDYLKECNVNCIHLMPFLDSPEGRSDGGYAVADFRKVKPELGTMEDLAKLTDACHAKDMNVCMDFVMNHTSEDHEWAKRARNGGRRHFPVFRSSRSSPCQRLQQSNVRLSHRLSREIGRASCRERV